MPYALFGFTNWIGVIIFNLRGYGGRKRRGSTSKGEQKWWKKIKNFIAKT
jgi:hypothetical protein